LDSLSQNSKNLFSRDMLSSYIFSILLYTTTSFSSIRINFRVQDLSRGNLIPLCALQGGDSSGRTVRRAQELVYSLVVDDKCFSTEKGARAFGEACSFNVLYEDCFQPQPVVGKTLVTKYLLDKVASRKGRGDVRVDMISDGDGACGFAWTWTCQDEEGLRGTTYVGLNDQGQIDYVREIPEPLYKPGDLTLELLKAVTAGAEPKRPKPYEPKTPTIACEVVDYLFNTVQGSSVDESMRLFDDSIIYRDFNYENVLRGKDEVRKFIEDFSFPGIEFRTQRIDDGVDSCCFTWEVALADAPDTIKGISFYKLDQSTRKISYVRDIPESAIKPPILGKLARDLRPGLGVFQGVKLGSRDGGW
jgi:hypothetical protein